MNKYIKKQVEITAEKTNKEMLIETLEGTMKASKGDYIITGVNGEKYPCKPDIFEKTYIKAPSNYIERMKNELENLVEKGTKLDKAISNLKGLTADELGLMYAQLYSMNSYADILKRRIELAEELNK